MVNKAAYLRIATEEAFITKDILAGYHAPAGGQQFQRPGLPQPLGLLRQPPEPARASSSTSACRTSATQRIADMDATGIDRQIIALTAPGVQVFDPATASALAIDANDQLAEACRKHPDPLHGHGRRRAA